MPLTTGSAYGSLWLWDRFENIDKSLFTLPGSPRWQCYLEKQKHGILVTLAQGNSVLPLCSVCLWPKGSLGTWLKRGKLGQCHQPVLYVGMEELLADSDIAGFEYLLCARHATTDFTPLPHLIDKVNPILPCRKSKAGGSRGMERSLQLAFHTSPCTHSPALLSLPGPSTIPAVPATLDTGHRWWIRSHKDLLEVQSPQRTSISVLGLGGLGVYSGWLCVTEIQEFKNPGTWVSARIWNLEQWEGIQS